MLDFVHEYRTEQLNSAVDLYRGPISLRNNQGNVVADGTVRLCWLPRPKVRFDIPEIPHGALPFHVGEAEFEIPDAIGSGSALISRTNIGSHRSSSMSGSIGRLQLGTTDGLKAVVFHLVNFGHFTSVRHADAPDDWQNDWMLWQANEWALVIQPVPGLRELENAVDDIGGYIISHTARLTRTDGHTFSSQDARQFHNLLFRFLSFVAGRRMNAILPVGFDAQEQPIWSEWGPWILDAWTAHDSWSDLHHAHELAPVFSGYAARRAEQYWRETLDLATYWYVESNRNPLSTETNVALTQVALERLAWEHFVRQGGMSKKKYKNLTARDQITHLLTDHQIPTAISPTYTELVQHNFADAVEALTKLRNNIVHPKKTLKPNSQVLWECRQTGLWMLELLLLRLCAYNGVYFDRREPNKFTGMATQVPWNP